VNLDTIPFPILIIIIPLLASFFIPILEWWKKGISYSLVLVTVCLSFFASIKIALSVWSYNSIQYYFGGWRPPWGIEYRIDHFNAFVAVLVCALYLLATIYSKQNTEKELPGKQVPFYCLFLLLFVGLLGIVLTGDMFNLYVFLEVASISAYGMIAMGQERATLSSFKYLIMGTIGACFYLIGVGYLYIATGSLNMGDLKELLPVLYQSKVFQTAFIFMIVGFGIKIALFPFHAWQPGAYTHSPSTVTIILSTAMAKTSIYAIIRVIFSVFTIDFIVGYLPIFDIICWIAVVAMIYGSVYAIRQVNLKKCLPILPLPMSVI
jgi:multicomponent Na+:H+ antiporter subunit D